MSALYNQTNQTPGTSQYITRQEVVQALSSIAGDLSGADLSTLFYNPNPKFSTIMMPSGGYIENPGSINTLALALSTCGSLTAARVWGTASPNLVQPTIANGAGSAPGTLVADSILATPAALNGSSFKVFYGWNGIYALNAASQNQNLAAYFPTNPAGSNWALTNVSSINGQQPNTSGTTFNTLTGNTLIANTVNTSQVIGVSSMNGVPYVAPASATYSGTASPGIPSGTLTSCFTITLPAGTLQPNRNYIFDVPFILGAFPPSPTNFQLLLGIRLGTNGITNVQMPYWIATNSTQNVTLQLTGIASTNPVSVASQTIEIMAIQSSGSTWTAPFSAPASGSGNNVWTLKALS